MQTQPPQGLIQHSTQPAAAVSHRYDVGLILFGLFCILLPALFIGLHWITPSDEARLSRGSIIYTDEGVFVSSYEDGTGQLKEGDLVTAIQGIELDSWARGLFGRGPDRLDWVQGQTLTYAVLREGETLELKIPLAALPLSAILRDHWSVILFFVVSQSLTAFVYFQRPEDPSARAFFIWAFSGSHTYSWAFFLQISDLVNPTGFWLFHLAATGLWLVFWASVVHMALVFPKPLIHLRHPLRWIFLLYLSPFLVFGSYLAWEWQSASSLLGWLDRWGTGQTLVAVLYTLPGLILILLQYFTSRSEVERIKTRWVIFGTIISLGLGLSLYFIPSLLGIPPIDANALGLINFPFIISMGIAIWRHRLFDIDLIIRRTLQYTLLTGLLVVVYFSVVVLLQSILTLALRDLGPAAGDYYSRLELQQGLQSPDERLSNAVTAQPPAVTIVLSTLAAAALFNPLRRRLQDFIDRRFYRQKYDAELALAEFAAAARSETDLEQLSVYLTEMVQDTLQPAQLVLWLLEPQDQTKQVEE